METGRCEKDGGVAGSATASAGHEGWNWSGERRAGISGEGWGAGDRQRDSQHIGAPSIRGRRRTAGAVRGRCGGAVRLVAGVGGGGDAEVVEREGRGESGAVVGDSGGRYL